MKVCVQSMEYITKEFKGLKFHNYYLFKIIKHDLEISDQKVKMILTLTNDCSPGP